MAAAMISATTIKPDTLAHIDLATLSQAELHALSLLSSSTAAAAAVSPFAAPKIDRSLFNESAGSRRQTYSSASAHHRRRVAALPKPPDPSPPPHPNRPDHDSAHNRLIIDRLKNLISRDPKFDGVHLLPPSLSPPPPPRSTEVSAPAVERKRKRGRKSKAELSALASEGGLNLNRNGVAVDVAAVAAMEDPYGAELRRRTAGVESEEGLLGFMRELDGQWGSRRKRRRIVDAAEFGDALPLGWKLLLGIKRKEGRAWIYCRRYISPSGQHFLSCKDVSLYLQSAGSLDTTHHLNYGHSLEDLQANRPKAVNHAGLIFKDSDRRQDFNSSSTLLIPASNEPGKENILLGFENLCEVQIQDLFECHKCNTTFDGKDLYLQHLLSFHQRITRRYRLGSSVGEGVIIKDGKYECQFCHKVFLERHRYNGHVRIHVRNYVRRVEEVPGPSVHQNTESPTGDNLCPRISKMDALIEIAQNLEASVTPSNESEHGSAPLTSHAISKHREHKTDSLRSKHKLDNSMTEQNRLDQQDNVQIVIDGSREKASGPCGIADVDVEPGAFMKQHNLASTLSIDQTICDAGNRKKVNSACSLEDSRFVVGCTDKNRDLKMNMDDSIGGTTNSTETQTIRKTSEGKEIQHDYSESSTSLLQPLPCLPSLNEASKTRHENVNGFDTLRLEEIESFKYGFGDGEESVDLQDVPIDLANSSEMECVFGSSVQFESEEVMLNMTRDPVTTLCIWCGIEFNHDDDDLEVQSDSVGFMCSSCKSKVTTQNDVLDNGSPVDPHSI